MRCAVGVSHHSGWAVLVTVGLEEDEPRLVDRRRITLLDDTISESRPYEHHGLALPAADAEALIARVRSSVETHAVLALHSLRDDLAPVHELAAVAVMASRFGRLGPLADALANRALLLAADGMLYAEAIEAAARGVGLTVFNHAKDAEFALAGQVLGFDEAETQAEVKALAFNAPWSAEHQRAAAAAIAALGDTVRQA